MNFQNRLETGFLIVVALAIFLFLWTSTVSGMLPEEKANIQMELTFPKNFFAPPTPPPPSPPKKPKLPPPARTT